MSKNIVKIEMEKMGIMENVVDNIMKFHGGIEAMLPDCNIPEKIKRCLRKNNWRLDIEKFRGRGSKWDDYIIIIKIDKTNISNIFNNHLTVHYKYPTKYGFMDGSQAIDDIFGDFIQLDKYRLKIDRFEYLELRYEYKHVNIHDMDD